MILPLSDNLCVRGINDAARGWRSAIYPVLYGIGAICFDLGMLILAIPLAVVFTPDLVIHGGIHHVDAMYLAIFVGMVCSLFFVFRNACQLMWWRHIESANPNNINRGEWIRDLPAIMGINALRDIAVYACSASSIISLIAILRNHTVLGMLIFAFSGVLLVCISVCYPTVLAEQLTTGTGVISSISAAIKNLRIHPLRALSIRIMTSFLRILLIALAAIYLAYGNGWAIIGCLVMLFIVTAIEPAFWLAAVNQQENVQK